MAKYVHVVWLNKHGPMPTWLWLGKTDPEHRKNWISYRYWIKIWYALPLWATREPIAAVYHEAARRRDAGEDVVVDHKVPLSHPLVCGLHCADNLQIITRRSNAVKSNYWQDGPPSIQLEFDLD